jgi:hypothetical protein
MLGDGVVPDRLAGSDRFGKPIERVAVHIIRRVTDDALPACAAPRSARWIAA